MFSKNDLLKFAFEEAIVSLNVNSVERKIAEAAIATKMDAYAKREGYKFSKNDVKKTINEGLGMLNKAGADFRLQTKMMY